MKDYLDREIKIRVGFLSSLASYFDEKQQLDDNEEFLLATLNAMLELERENK